MLNHAGISVLTIVYNGERYISETIDSVLNQTHTNFEYVLVDNNSKDSTPKILKQYADKDVRIKVIREQKQGVLYARNTGLRAAEGEWIAILDSDDVALPNRLEMQLDFVKNHPNVILLGSGHILVDDDGRVLKTENYPGNHETLVEYLENNRSIFAHSSSFYQRETVLRLNGYRFPHAEDYDLWFRLSIEGKISCIEEPLIKLRRSISSRSYNINQEHYILHVLAALVCHLRRKNGFSDPYCVNNPKWNDFLSWIYGQMDNLNVFRKGKAKRELHRIWYSKGYSKPYRIIQVLFRVFMDRYARAYFQERSFLRNAAYRIADDSKMIWD